MVSTYTVNDIRKTMELFDESEVKSAPRLIITGANWRTDITNTIMMDKNLLDSKEFIVTGKVHGLDDVRFDGSLVLALHNVLAKIESPTSMVIIVEKVLTKYVKGIKARRTEKYTYIVIKS